MCMSNTEACCSTAFLTMILSNFYTFNMNTIKIANATFKYNHYFASYIRQL